MNREPKPRRTQPRATTVMRPGIDARTEILLRDSRHYDPDDAVVAGTEVLLYGAPPVGMAAFLWWMTDDMAAPEVFHQVLAWWPAAAGVVMVAAVVRAVVEARHGRAIRRTLELSGQWVQPDELVPAADELLARAQNAMRQVRNSAVHRQGLLDRDRNEAMFPVQEWEIATALRDYSRLVSQEPTRPHGTEVIELIESRRRPIEAGHAAILRRVEALESFATQVGEADARYTEVRQIQQLTADSDEVLDFLARTVRDDLAIAEIDELTSEAAIVAASFTKALETAREGATLVLSFSKTS